MASIKKIRLSREPKKYLTKLIESIHQGYKTRAITNLDDSKTTKVDPTNGQGHYNDVGKSKKCAYVTLMMIGDAYLPGALVLADSLRRVKSKWPVVIMVTPDVSKEVRQILATVYNDVIPVEYIEYKCVSMPGSLNMRYGHWNSKGFTKFNMMALTQFDKVLYLETDEQVVQNIDHLFEMPTPVGLFTSPWGWPMANKIMNPYIGLKEGDYVQPWMVIEAFHNYGHGSISSLVLLRPEEGLLADFKKEVEQAQPFGFKKAMSTIEEIALPWYYIMTKGIPMYQSHIRYGWVPWKKWIGGEKNIFVNHFFGLEKPWKEPRDKYSDDYWNLWWDAYDQIYAKHKPKQQEVLDKLCSPNK